MRKKPAAPHPVIWHCSSIRIFLIRKEIWKPISWEIMNWNSSDINRNRITNNQCLMHFVTSISQFYEPLRIFNKIPLSLWSSLSCPCLSCPLVTTWWGLVQANNYQCFDFLYWSLNQTFIRMCAVPNSIFCNIPCDFDPAILLVNTSSPLFLLITFNTFSIRVINFHSQQCLYNFPTSQSTFLLEVNITMGVWGWLLFNSVVFLVHLHNNKDHDF